MCGIFGYCGRIPPKKWKLAHKFISNLARESQVRGTDSTGFACRWPGNKILMDKQPIRAENFIKTSYKFRSIKSNMPTTFIGHTRLGTGSSPTIAANNHPFIGENFIMVHNGVVPSWKDIKTKFGLNIKSETDSEVIIRALEKIKKRCKNTPKSIEWTLENIWGNMAVALLEINSPNIWLFRNENPCFVFTFPEKIFNCEFRAFASTRNIFARAFKETFDTNYSKHKISAELLNDNQCYRLSTIAILTNNNEKHRYIHYPINVKKKFYRKTTYYTSTSQCSADEHGKYKSAHTNPASHFFSKYNDGISNGSLFSDDDRVKIHNLLEDKDVKRKRFFLDGLSLNEFVSLQDKLENFRSTEEKISAEN